MNARAYILMDTVNDQSEEVVNTLRGMLGIRMADCLEDAHDVVLVVEAPNRRKLAALTMQALALVETMTRDLRIMPAYKAERLSRA